MYLRHEHTFSSHLSLSFCLPFSLTHTHRHTQTHSHDWKHRRKHAATHFSPFRLHSHGYNLKLHWPGRSAMALQSLHFLACLSAPQCITAWEDQLQAWLKLSIFQVSSLSYGPYISPPPIELAFTRPSTFFSKQHKNAKQCLPQPSCCAHGHKGLKSIFCTEWSPGDKEQWSWTWIWWL